MILVPLQLGVGGRRIGTVKIFLDGTIKVIVDEPQRELYEDILIGFIKGFAIIPTVIPAVRKEDDGR